MRIVWDEPKRLITVETRGMDFADLDLAFFETALIVAAKDGRLMAINQVAPGVTLSVVFARLGTEAISVVSMRHASQKERTAYENAQG